MHSQRCHWPSLHVLSLKRWTDPPLQLVDGSGMRACCTLCWAPADTSVTSVPGCCHVLSFALRSAHRRGRSRPSWQFLEARDAKTPSHIEQARSAPFLSRRMLGPLMSRWKAWAQELVTVCRLCPNCVPQAGTRGVMLCR